MVDPVAHNVGANDVDLVFDLLLMAPVTTLFVIQGSPFATVGASLERIVGTCVGVALATLYIDHVTLNALTLAAGMLVAAVPARPAATGGSET